MSDESTPSWDQILEKGLGDYSHGYTLPDQPKEEEAKLDPKKSIKYINKTGIYIGLPAQEGAQLFKNTNLTEDPVRHHEMHMMKQAIYKGFVKAAMAKGFTPEAADLIFKKAAPNALNMNLDTGNAIASHISQMRQAGTPMPQLANSIGQHIPAGAFAAQQMGLGNPSFSKQPVQMPSYLTGQHPMPAPQGQQPPPHPMNNMDQIEANQKQLHQLATQ